MPQTKTTKAKKPAPKAARTTASKQVKRPASKPVAAATMSNGDYLAAIWLALILVFLVFVIKDYVTG